MKVFIAPGDQALLASRGFTAFDTLWALPLTAVDEANVGRGGWSQVFRLDLGDQGFYLKRQANYLTRSLRHPLGEPTVAREFRNIRRYQQLGVPALEASYFAERHHNGEWQAMLLTRALDGWSELGAWLAQWPVLTSTRRAALTQACGELARRLHRAGLVHGCFYPKHIFLRAEGEGFEARLIDLEKTRGTWLGQRDRVRDLEPLLRRAQAWSETDIRGFLSAYLQAPANDPQVTAWMEQLVVRRRHKEAR
ncbi:lipopolysaccharide kinase InaA family protein [Pseudomonas sp. RIT-PI-S]|uniref:lipopolysaccharide kinase InaA family protein n=1 Tax=Pseudomonas sp. RIT-PI-S TaxID=3035295 RepID=UPI0021D9F974|nr:lipopolysaccharide kinase InaA family protein [Pseudomonas sp. RIT-PI-S]